MTGRKEVAIARAGIALVVAGCRTMGFFMLRAWSILSMAPAGADLSATVVTTTYMCYSLFGLAPLGIGVLLYWVSRTQE